MNGISALRKRRDRVFDRDIALRSRYSGKYLHGCSILDQKIQRVRVLVATGITHIAVVNLCCKPEIGRSEGVVIRELQLYSK